MIEDYQLAIEKILKEAISTPPRCALGPELLQKMSKARDGVLYGVGLFTYEMMTAIASGEGSRILRSYEQLAGCKLTAANLCHFKRDKSDINTRLLFDLVYDRAISWLQKGSTYES